MDHFKSKDIEKYIDIYNLYSYYDWCGHIAISDVLEVVQSVINGEVQEPFSIRKKKCAYSNKYKLNLNTSYVMEWNFQKNCYRLKQLDTGSYEYFDGVIQFIYFIHDEVRNLEGPSKENILEEVESFIIKIFEEDENNPEPERLIEYLYEGDIVITSEDLPF